MILSVILALLAFPPCVFGTRDALVEHYFHLGYDYGLILCFLHFLHGISISLRQLKRILKRLGLRRRTLQDRTLLLDTLGVIEVGVVAIKFNKHECARLGVLFLESASLIKFITRSCARG